MSMFFENFPGASPPADHTSPNRNSRLRFLAQRAVQTSCRTYFVRTTKVSGQ